MGYGGLTRRLKRSIAPDPADLPHILFYLFKKSLCSKLGNSVLRRSKRRKIYPVTTCDIEWTANIIVVV